MSHGEGKIVFLEDPSQPDRLLCHSVGVLPRTEKCNRGDGEGRAEESGEADLDRLIQGGQYRGWGELTENWGEIHKYKYTNKNTQIQMHKYKYTNINTQIQIHKYIYTNKNTQIQKHKNK